VSEIGGNVNGVETLTFRLYTPPSGGAPIWTEVQPVVAVKRIGDITGRP